jgi:hypothetical protein
MATQPFPQCYRIKTACREYNFGAEFDEIRGHEAEVKAALEYAECSTEPFAVRDTITLIGMGGLPMTMMPPKAAKVEAVPVAKVTPVQARRKSVQVPQALTPVTTTLNTIGEAAAKLRKTLAWMRAHSNGSRQPTIPRVKMGKGYGFEDKDLDEFKASCRETATPRRKRKAKK